MSFQNDWIKLLIFEAKPGKQLNSFAWNSYLVEDIEEIDYMEYASDALARAAYVTNATLPTGGTITISGTKRIHTFTAGGTFALPTGVSGNVEVLVVAGGGGGGRGAALMAGGGGGGGGVQYSAAHALGVAASIAVTIGGGGPGATSDGADGTNGSNSVFNTLTAVGGGGGAGCSTTSKVGVDGGCGGGASGGQVGANSAGGAGSQGGNGGTGFNGVSGVRSGAGGGGASPDNGDNAASAVGGGGGAGYASSISGAAAAYAGGGGGSSQGATQGSGVDGGGNGSKTATGGAGTANTGGGGGGGCAANNGGAGGSGIVIISYVLEDFYALQDFSEGTIKTQGSYSLKGIATTGSLNKTLTRTIGVPLDLTYRTHIKFDIYSSRTGSNIKVGFHDAGGYISYITPNITSAGAWQAVDFDISAVADADKNAIDSIIITIVNADAGNIFYIDNLYAYSYPVYYTDLSIGEIVEIEEDGSDLSKQISAASCVATPSSFYHDFWAGRLYIHLAGSDSPAAFVSPDYTHDIVAFVWKGFCNRQGENGATVAYIPEGCTYPIFYDPSLRPGTLSELTAAVADHFESAMQMTSGSVAMVNDLAAWYALVDDWYWENADARARVGQLGDAYLDLDKIFVGKISDPEISDVEIVFQLFDAREGRLQSIPADHYDTTTYLNLHENAVGQPIPILFGQKTNIMPACIDTVNHKYKISATHFNSGADVFEMQAVDAVRHKGIGLALTSQYTADLHNGEITILFDPGDGEVQVDAKGIKDQFDFDTSPFGAATGVFSENVADHLFFVLHILNQIPVSEFDLTSFAELQAVRTQAVAWLLDTDVSTLDFNRLMQQTSLYHFLPLADGTFAARYYRKTVPAGTLELRDYDHKDFKKKKPSTGVFRDIFLRYDKNPSTGEWKQVIHSEPSVNSRYRKKDPYTLETALRAESEALAVLAFYVSLLKTPPIKIETSISLIGRNLIPTDKLYVNRNVVADGHEVVVNEDEVYVILETRKNLQEGRVGLTAQLDTQLAIYTVHADSPHQDVPHADHSDAVHEDDAHGNSHTDVAHVDTAHVDSTYTDHDDRAYFDYLDADHYTDREHLDHDDNVHSDVAHGDVAYHDHPHVDTGHIDHTDTIHEDSHTDISHIDSEV